LLIYELFINLKIRSYVLSRVSIFFKKHFKQQHYAQNCLLNYFFSTKSSCNKASGLLFIFSKHIDHVHFQTTIYAFPRSLKDLLWCFLVAKWQEKSTRSNNPVKDAKWNCMLEEEEKSLIIYRQSQLYKGTTTSFQLCMVFWCRSKITKHLFFQVFISFSATMRHASSYWTYLLIETVLSTIFTTSIPHNISFLVFLE